GDGGADVGAPDRLAESPGNRGENESSGDRVGVGQEIEMYGVRRDAGPLDSQVGEENPEQLDELHRYQQRPETDSRKLSFERQGRRRVGDRVNEYLRRIGCSNARSTAGNSRTAKLGFEAVPSSTRAPHA